MQEEVIDLWTVDGWKVITTNGFVKNNGCAVMGRGCAKEAAQRYPNLPSLLGQALRYGNQVYVWREYGIITFPVKDNWWEKASLQLIEKSAKELVQAVKTWKMEDKIYLPRPGCGNGGLDWKEVKKVIEPILDDRFVVIIKPSKERMSFFYCKE